MKKTFIYSAVSQAVLLAIATPAMAEEQVTQLDEIVVSGGSMFKMGEVPFHQAKSAVAVSREDLDKQAVSKADELGRYQSGFSNQVFGNDTNTNWFRVRGTEVSQAVNGLPTFSYGFFTPYVETFGLEAVEVTKGADSMTFGAANSGGLINYVTKRPHQDQIGKGEFKLSGGTQNSYGFGADYTGKISDDEKVRYRIVTSYNAKDGDWDKTNNKTFYIAPTLAWDISDRTRLNILTSYQRDAGTPSSNFLPQEGTLKPSPNGYISRNANLGDPNSDKETNRQYSVGYELEHNFGNGLNFNSSYRYSHTQNYHLGTYPFNYYLDNAYTVPRGFVFNDGKMISNVADNRLSWDFANDWLKNKVVVGTDYRQNKVDTMYDPFGYDFGTFTARTSSTNAFNPQIGWGATRDFSGVTHRTIKARQLGFYLQNSTRFADKFNLGLGIRHDRAKQDEYTSTQSVKNNHTSYSASFMYEAPFGLNPYVSYSESFNLPVGISGNQKLYDPNITKQYEVGVKYLPTWLDGSITVAGFRAKDKGALIASPTQNGLGVTVSSADTIRRQGVEVQMDTNLTQNWNLGLAYTYLKSVTKKATGDVRNPLIPTSTLAAKTAYTFENGALKDLTLGAGLRYVGHSVTSTGSLYSGAKVPSATVVDLMARYQVTPNLALQVNADNVGNRRYVAGCDYYCYYGAERKISGSLSYKF